MSSDFRETTLTLAGVAHTIRTERTGSVKQLEAAHLKAVKAAIDNTRAQGVARRNAEELASLRAKTWEDREGFPGSGERSRSNAIVQAEIRHLKYTAPKVRNVTCNYVDARKGLPKVTFGKPVPEYLVEVAPGEYATAEAAEGMAATEHVDEILPGLAVVRRQAIKTTWVLRHTPSYTEGAKEVHLGPVFKTRERAREVVSTELAHLDWTRGADELLADEATGATVRYIKLREFVAASKRNAWATAELREAEAALPAPVDAAA